MEKTVERWCAVCMFLTEELVCLRQIFFSSSVRIDNFDLILLTGILLSQHACFFFVACFCHFFLSSFVIIYHLFFIAAVIAVFVFLFE